MYSSTRLWNSRLPKINQEYKNVVVSHKALIEAELEQQKKEIISKLEKGQVLEGKVKNITAYGVFVDLGGVDGLVHITDLSWGRVSDPHEVVELDQDIKVVILDFDNEKKRIALRYQAACTPSLGQSGPDTQGGRPCQGRVVVMADYGAFVEVQPGVEGLIHVSEMSWSQHLRSAQDFLKAGDEVEAVVLTLDREERKMSLGLKQLKKDPWGGHRDQIRHRQPPHRESPQLHPLRQCSSRSKREWTVSSTSPTSAGQRKSNIPSEFTQVGNDIEVQVLPRSTRTTVVSRSATSSSKRIPWDSFESKFTVGSIHQGTVIEVLDKGAVISLEDGVEGFATPKHLVKRTALRPSSTTWLPSR